MTLDDGTEVFGNGVGALDIGDQYLGAQAYRGEIELVAGDAQVALSGKPKALGAVIEPLLRITDQILRQWQATR